MRRGVLFRHFLEERKLKLSKVLTGKKNIGLKNQHVENPGA